MIVDSCSYQQQPSEWIRLSKENSKQLDTNIIGQEHQYNIHVFHRPSAPHIFLFVQQYKRWTDAANGPPTAGQVSLNLLVKFGIKKFRFKIIVIPVILRLSFIVTSTTFLPTLSFDTPSEPHSPTMRFSMVACIPILLGLVSLAWASPIVVSCNWFYSAQSLLMIVRV